MDKDQKLQELEAIQTELLDIQNELNGASNVEDLLEEIESLRSTVHILTLQYLPDTTNSENHKVFFDFPVDELKIKISDCIGYTPFNLRDDNVVGEVGIKQFHYSVLELEEEVKEMTKSFYISVVNKDLNSNPIKEIIVEGISTLHHNTISLPIKRNISRIILEVRWIVETKPTCISDLQADYTYLINTIIGDKFKEEAKILDELKKPFLSATAAYSEAYNNFDSALAANKEEGKLRDALIMNLLSIAGGGMLSWLSTSLQFVDGLKKLSDSINIAEDVAQISLDKFITFPGTDKSVKLLGLKQPMDFYIELETKVTTICSDLSTVIGGIHNFFSKKLHSIDNRKQAKKKINLDEEYEIYKTFVEKIYLDGLDSVKLITGLGKNINIPSNASTLLEEGLWAYWFNQVVKISQKSHGNRSLSKYHDCTPYIGWPIINRLKALGIAKKVGVVFSSFEASWVDEIILVKEWAKNYEVKQLF